MTSTTPPDRPPRGFPIITVIATLLALFLFLGLTLLLYNSPFLSSDKAEGKVDPYIKRSEVEARNQAVLEGKAPGARPMSEAAPEYLAKVKAGSFPFPVQPPAKAGEKK